MQIGRDERYVRAVAGSADGGNDAGGGAAVDNDVVLGLVCSLWEGEGRERDEAEQEKRKDAGSEFMHEILKTISGLACAGGAGRDHSPIQIQRIASIATSPSVFSVLMVTLGNSPASRWKSPRGVKAKGVSLVRSLK